jgi:hypothetical protein
MRSFEREIDVRSNNGPAGGWPGYANHRLLIRFRRRRVCSTG